MALSHLHFFSRVLGKQVGANILLPDSGDGPFATFYLLHGLSDDYTLWQRRTSLERYVAGLPLVVVMPDGFRGAYTNNTAGPAYADYIVQDVVGTIERLFLVKKTRASRAIGGLSMGGYGALRLGLGFPDMFASVNSHSGALAWGTRSRGSAVDRHAKEFDAVFGENPAGTDHDLLTLAQRCRDAGTLPELLIDCGESDYLIDENRVFTKQLGEMKIPHTYREFPGAHDWDYWDTHVRDAIAFHAKNLAIV